MKPSQRFGVQMGRKGLGHNVRNYVIGLREGRAEPRAQTAPQLSRLQLTKSCAGSCTNAVLRRAFVYAICGV